MELSILVFVLLMLALAKTLGEAVSRVNQPPIVGELLAGIVLGPFLLGKVFDLRSMYASQFISDLADLGMLFLMLYVGLEFSAKRLLIASWLGAGVAGVGIAVPFLLGLALGVAAGLEGSLLLFTGIAVSVTALPVTIRILKDLEVLETRTSSVIISASLITDLCLLFALALVLGREGAALSMAEILLLAVGFVGFFVVAFLVGRYVFPPLYRLLRYLRTGEAAFAVAVIVAIAFAAAAEWVGLPAFIGAFIAGIMLRESGTNLKVWVRVEDILSGITLGLLAPVFFVLIGFSVEFDVMFDALPLLVGITAVAVVGKLVGSYAAARIAALGRNEAMAIGSMMMSKGAIELVFARLALSQGLFDERPELFSVLVLMAFASTVLAAVMFRHFFNRAVLSGEDVGRPG